MGGEFQGAWYPKLCQNICLLHIDWYQKKTGTLGWAGQNIDFEWVVSSNYVKIYVSQKIYWYQKNSALASAVQKIDFLGPGGVAPKNVGRQNYICSATTLHKD